MGPVALWWHSSGTVVLPGGLPTRLASTPCKYPTSRNKLWVGHPAWPGRQRLYPDPADCFPNVVGSHSGRASLHSHMSLRSRGASPALQPSALSVTVTVGVDHGFASYPKHGNRRNPRQHNNPCLVKLLYCTVLLQQHRVLREKLETRIARHPKLSPNYLLCIAKTHLKRFYAYVGHRRGQSEPGRSEPCAGGHCRRHGIFHSK